MEKVNGRATITNDLGITRPVKVGYQFKGPDGEDLIAVPPKWVIGDSQDGQKEKVHREVNGHAAVVQEAG